MLVHPKTVEGKNNAFITKGKNSGKDHILRDIEQLTEFPPQVCQIVRVHRDNGHNFQRSEASTVLYLCFFKLVPIGLELYHL